MKSLFIFTLFLSINSFAQYRVIAPKDISIQANSKKMLLAYTYKQATGTPDLSCYLKYTPQKFERHILKNSEFTLTPFKNVLVPPPNVDEMIQDLLENPPAGIVSEQLEKELRTRQKDIKTVEELNKITTDYGFYVGEPIKRVVSFKLLSIKTNNEYILGCSSISDAYVTFDEAFEMIIGGGYLEPVRDL